MNIGKYTIEVPLAVQVISGTTVSGSAIATEDRDGASAFIFTCSDLGTTPTFSGYIQASGSAGYAQISGATFSTIASGANAYSSVAYADTRSGKFLMPVITISNGPYSGTVVSATADKY